MTKNTKEYVKILIAENKIKEAIEAIEPKTRAKSNKLIYITLNRFVEKANAIGGINLDKNNNPLIGVNIGSYEPIPLHWVNKNNIKCVKTLNDIINIRGWLALHLKRSEKPKSLNISRQHWIVG